MLCPSGDVSDEPPANCVNPPAATVLPSGEMATALILPSLPSPMGGRRIFSRFPFFISHTRTVLSCEPVTRKRFWASTPILPIFAVCIPVSMRSMGAVGGSAAWHALRHAQKKLKAANSTRVNTRGFFMVVSPLVNGFVCCCLNCDYNCLNSDSSDLSDYSDFSQALYCLNCDLSDFSDFSQALYCLNCDLSDLSDYSDFTHALIKFITIIR